MDADTVSVYAPGSIGNVGPGLDILGLAVTGAGDRVTVTRTAIPGIQVLEAGHPALPADPQRHASAIAVREVCARAAVAPEGFALQVEKGLPLAGGQGGSAASAAAAAVAANLLLGGPLSPVQLVEAAMAAEAVVAGRHADNVAPSILGGLVLIRQVDPLDLVPLPVAPGLHLVLLLPDQQLRTEASRRVLPEAVSREVALAQAANVAGVVTGLLLGDFALAGRSLVDAIAEPAREPLLPGFREAKAALLDAGALGAGLSGSGPTLFAMADSLEAATRIAEAGEMAYTGLGIRATSRVAGVDPEGARRE